MRGVSDMAVRLPAWYALDLGGKGSILVGIAACDVVELRTCCTLTVPLGRGY